MMKKITMLTILVLGILGLSSCIVEDDPVDDDNITDSETELEAVSMSLQNTFNEHIDGELMFYILSENISDTAITHIYVGMEGENEFIYVYRSEYMGRWDLINYIIMIDISTDSILAIEIMSHGENWGSFIEGDSFLSQFEGKDVDYYLSNDIELGVDGNASATTTINGFNSTLEEAVNHYLDNLQ